MFKKDKQTALSKIATARHINSLSFSSVQERLFFRWLTGFLFFNVMTTFGPNVIHPVNRNQYFLKKLINFLLVVSFILLRYNIHQFWYYSVFIFNLTSDMIN